MIKRRFYKLEHANKDHASDSSSYSDAEIEAEAETTELEDTSAAQTTDESSTSSGITVNVEDDENESGKQISANLFDRRCAETLDKLSHIGAEKDLIPNDDGTFILKRKSVFKCRLCPRVVCLNEDSLTAHVKSKRHVRSEKLLKEGRLKFMLNSDAEMEENGETHAERHARLVNLMKQDKPRKNNKKGRQGKKITRKKMENGLEVQKAKKPVESPAKKRHKTGKIKE